MIDNRELVAQYIDVDYDGDTFWYTELLDRTNNGSSRFKMLRSFEHQDRATFLEQCDTIAQLCERNNVRAYTRLTPRSRKAVAGRLLTQVTQQYIDGHYDALWHAYGSACGKSSIHARKLWLFDIDKPVRIGDLSIQYNLIAALQSFPEYRGAIPSRNGQHLITTGFDPRRLPADWERGASLHKDNPTNLYIPKDAR